MAEMLAVGWLDRVDHIAMLSTPPRLGGLSTPPSGTRVFNGISGFKELITAHRQSVKIAKGSRKSCWKHSRPQVGSKMPFLNRWQRPSKILTGSM